MNFTVIRLSSSTVFNSLGNSTCYSKVPYLFKSNQNQMRTLICKRNRVTYHNKTFNERNHEQQNSSKTGVYGYFLLGIPVVTFILGTWQIQRRKWKLDLINMMESRIAMEPRELPENLQKLNSMEYCPVKVRGKFIHEKEFTIGPRSFIVDGAGLSEGKGNIFTSGQGTRGYNVITPFKLDDQDLTILVNRGWVPAKYKDPSTRQLGQIQGTLELIGVVRLNETRPQFLPKNQPDKGMWFYRDLNAMAEMTGTNKVFIDLMANNHIPGTPLGGQTRITLRNEHLSYIITWYSLSAITGYLWYRQYVQKLPLL